LKRQTPRSSVLYKTHPFSVYHALDQHGFIGDFKLLSELIILFKNQSY